MTYALVDPDESVRARAQDLPETVLADRDHCHVDRLFPSMGRRGANYGGRQHDAVETPHRGARKISDAD